MPVMPEIPSSLLLPWFIKNLHYLGFNEKCHVEHGYLPAEIFVDIDKTMKEVGL
jgi:hypothetical protein